VNYKTFKKVSREIEKEKAIISLRRKEQRELDADKLLTLHVFNELSRKGDSFKYTYMGQEFEADPKQLAKFRTKETKHFKRAGITVKSLMKRTDNKWIRRSKQEIKTGFLSQFKGNKAIILTGKTSESKWKKSNHRTVIELKQYQEYLNQTPPDGDYGVNVKAAIAGTIGVYCDCEDFQYRRNYWVSTIGAYVTSDRHIKPETAFPKITHPAGQRGPLCIHLVKACKILLTPIAIGLIKRTMKRDAASVTPGHDKPKSLTEKEFEKFLEDQGAEKVEAIKNEWLDKGSRKAFQQFKKAGDSFKKHGKDMLSKAVKKAEDKAKVKIKAAEKKTAKISDALNKSIRLLLKTGMNQKDIAKELEIPQKQVQDVAKDSK
jgi:hypothetical protein